MVFLLLFYYVNYYVKSNTINSTLFQLHLIRYNIADCVNFVFICPISTPNLKNLYSYALIYLFLTKKLFIGILERVKKL